MARRRRPLTTLLLALPLMPLPGGAAPAAGLQGSHWQLLEIQSMDDGQGPRRPPADQPVTMALLAGGQARLQLSCNRAMGTWRLSPSADPGNGGFRFGPLATTRMACPEPSLEPLLSQQLPLVRGYRVDGSRLSLSLMADGGLLIWQRLDGPGGPLQWQLLERGQPIPLRLAPSERAPVLRELPAGSRLGNLGCSSGEGSWCRVQLGEGGARGSVPLETLRVAAP